MWCRARAALSGISWPFQKWWTSLQHYTRIVLIISSHFSPQITESWHLYLQIQKGQLIKLGFNVSGFFFTRKMRNIVQFKRNKRKNGEAEGQIRTQHLFDQIAIDDFHSVFGCVTWSSCHFVLPLSHVCNSVAEIVGLWHVIQQAVQCQCIFLLCH